MPAENIYIYIDKYSNCSAERESAVFLQNFIIYFRPRTQFVQRRHRRRRIVCSIVLHISSRMAKKCGAGEWGFGMGIYIYIYIYVHVCVCMCVKVIDLRGAPSNEDTTNLRLSWTRACSLSFSLSLGLWLLRADMR